MKLLENKPRQLGVAKLQPVQASSFEFGLAGGIGGAQDA